MTRRQSGRRRYPAWTNSPAAFSPFMLPPYRICTPAAIPGILRRKLAANVAVHILGLLGRRRHARCRSPRPAHRQSLPCANASTPTTSSTASSCASITRLRRTGFALLQRLADTQNRVQSRPPAPPRTSPPPARSSHHRARVARNGRQSTYVAADIAQHSRRNLAGESP